MKVYTKTGDKGTTGLIGGTRVPKNHIRLEAYGTIDELNSSLGWLRSYDLDKKDIDRIVYIQENLFAVGSNLAMEKKIDRLNIPDVSENIVDFLEKAIDEMDQNLPELKNFVLPGGHEALGICHLSRSICRRAERNIIRLAEESDIAERIIVFINRLSDYLFVLSRKISVDFKVIEIPWITKR